MIWFSALYRSFNSDTSRSRKVCCFILPGLLDMLERIGQLLAGPVPGHPDPPNPGKPCAGFLCRPGSRPQWERQLAMRSLAFRAILLGVTLFSCESLRT